jgi:hypothetical protein
MEAWHLITQLELLILGLGFQLFDSGVGQYLTM